MSAPARAAAPARWLFPAEAAEPAGRAVASAFLAHRDATERQLLALVYGYALDVGLAAWTLDLDAALAHWRLRAALAAPAADGGGPGPLERAVAALLSGPGGPSDEARRIADELPPEARARLQAALEGTRVEATHETARPGLGVGSLVLVALAIAAFLLYGVIRDSNPLWHGQNLVRRGDFEAARVAFEELGSQPEARAWTAIAWLAEGNYPRALEALATPGAASNLALFRPMDEPLETIEADPESRALLPRGLISTPSPEIVYGAGPAGEIVFLGHPLEGSTDTFRPLRLRVPDTSGGASPIIVLSWPEDVGALPPGNYTWSVPGSELHQGSFTLLPDELRLELDSHARERLSAEIPYHAMVFLRAHYFLRNRLYMQAGQLFAGLSRRFPEQEYPRTMVAQVAAALGVDPSAFLR